MSRIAETKAFYFGRRPVVTIPVGAVKRVSAGGCIALSCTHPLVTHCVSTSPTGWNPCRCRMHCVTVAVALSNAMLSQRKAMQVPRVPESLGSLGF